MEKIIAGISAAIDSLPAKSGRRIIAIDGRCASGKTTLAAALGERLGADVFHMDDFFLRPEQRTPERLGTPGGNVDYERFYAEVLRPLRDGEKYIEYRPYDCSSRSLKGARIICPGELAIVEGAYSAHPRLRELYDLRIFMTVAPDEQMLRITERGGSEAAEVFRDRWIPLEERYFAECGVEGCCELRFDNSTNNR